MATANGKMMEFALLAGDRCGYLENRTGKSETKSDAKTAAQRWSVETMAEETGTVLPWEKDAMAGLEMPDGLSYPDQILYMELRMLYHQYYQKVIDRETATKEKKKLLDEYRVYQHREEMGNHWVEIIRLTELARTEYRKNPCNENAIKLIEIIEGRKL